MRVIDLTNQVFGRLTVIERAENNQNHPRWLCRCTCGNEKVILGFHLRSGTTKSCGCLSVEKTVARTTVHGHKRKCATSGIYRTWASIITRCTNPNIPHYHLYGGRGITVCDRWKQSFESFLEDVGERPSPDHSIDRIDNNRGYEPGNVRWATRTEQGRNKRSNRHITIDGETHCLSEWEEIKGLPRKKITTRLCLGWDEYDAVMTPLGGRSRKEAATCIR
jgi:hypothetical protein